MLDEDLNGYDLLNPAPASMFSDKVLASAAMFRVAQSF